MRASKWDYNKGVGLIAGSQLGSRVRRIAGSPLGLDRDRLQKANRLREGRAAENSFESSEVRGGVFKQELYERWKTAGFYLFFYMDMVRKT